MDHINYTVRVSRRARHARIVVHPDMRVEVILPEGIPEQRAAALLQEKRGWIERSLKHFDEHGRADELYSDFPEQVHFKSTGQSFMLLYRQTGVQSIRIKEVDSELQITGKTDDADILKAALQKWLKAKAREKLEEMLDQLAKLYGFRYQRLSIRLQKSRWGSCSASGNISLNAKLLFLPEELARYVMLHELAHLKYMNHSNAFWRVVAACDADYLLHRKQMRSTLRWIPKWVDPA